MERQYDERKEETFGKYITRPLDAFGELICAWGDDDVRKEVFDKAYQTEIKDYLEA